MTANGFTVIGAGMVGAACAYRLQSAGHAVTLVDPGPKEAAASFGNAGHIAVEQVEPLASWATIRSAPGMLFGVGGPLDFRLTDIGDWAPWAVRFMAASGRERFEAGVLALENLMVDAVAAWESLLRDVGRTDLMCTDGHAVLWFDDNEVRRGRAKWAAARTGPVTLHAMEAGQLTRYAAALPGRPPVAGLRFEGTARLASPQAVRDALIEAFVAAGGERIPETVGDVSRDGAVRLSDGQVLSGSCVLIAGGAGSRALMRSLGVAVPLIAERGYSIQIPSTAWPADLPTAVVEGQSIVLAPHSEGLRATSYVELARPGSPPDKRKWRRLEDRVRAMGVAVSSDCQRWIGCRPTLPDYLPAIGALEGGRILYAFGHQHLGVTLAAITAERVLELARGEARGLSTFDIGRFG